MAATKNGAPASSHVRQAIAISGRRQRRRRRAMG
jgi:hypothetical protein